MELAKLIADVRESVSAISDDRRIDNRYIEHLINVGRADFIKKLLSARPGYDTINLEQNYHANIESASRSIFPNVDLACSVLRSTAPVPAMITSDILSHGFRIRTADILKDTIETITAERATNISFEFNATYAFIDYEHYLYLISKNNHQELKYAVVTGIFEDPKEVDPTLEDCPLSNFMWGPIKENIVQQLLRRPMEDPINNSEPDLIVDDRRRENSAES